MVNAKRAAILVAMAWCSQASSGVVYTGQAAAHVRARILPQITVSDPVVVIIDLQDHLIGTRIPSQIRFSIRANTPEVELHVACTDLYQMGDPTSAHKIPVAGLGARITCEHAASRLLAWADNAPAESFADGWTGRVSKTGVFAAPTGRGFSQDVNVDVSWYTADRNLPRGEYQGVVRLIGMARP